MTSATTFSAGASFPLLTVWLSPFGPRMIVEVSAASLLFLTMLGVIGAKTGGAPVGKATLRVAFWGAIAMAITAGIGKLVGSAI